MILVDTSIWVDHLRNSNGCLTDLLGGRRVLCHPSVVGELALGGAQADVAATLRQLPSAVVATDEEVLDFIMRHGIAGRGIGYVDAHLLASTCLTDAARLWTSDKSLRALAETFDVSLHVGP